MVSEHRPQLAATVVICTYNRPRMLEMAVRSCLANATRKSLGFEIVIADNSRDGHAVPLVESLKGEAIAVRRVPASPPNISIARNAGLRAARAGLVAFMDDDLELEPGWLDALVETLESAKADAAVGPVRAKFAAGPPAWDRHGLRFERVLPFASGTPIPVMGPGRPAGFAISTASSIWRVATCFTDPEPFDRDFGVSGGEDLDLFMRLERRGRRIVWCAEAGVRETIPADRTTFWNQVMRGFSGAQAYAAATIKNSDGSILRGLDIMARGAAQSVAYALLALPLAVLAPASPAARERLVQTVLKLAAGLGKVLWWRKLGYYHLEKPQASAA
ncbi:MAG: glycosyltransferase family 2 protein [Hyphomicrobiaceae bacterium]|nr:glycosyltransferase family 2 protein [Hyphomicrobiaceae bacterium]